MKTVQIFLNSIDKVKSFVNDISKFDYDFDLERNLTESAKCLFMEFYIPRSSPVPILSDVFVIALSHYKEDVAHA